MQTVNLYLKSGAIIEAHYAEDEFDDIYDTWSKGRGILGFDNCSLRAEEVAAITWSDA